MIKAPATMIGQIAAYAVGGGAMTALHSACYWLMATFGEIEPYIANSLAAMIAGVAGYNLHSRWTFGAEARASTPGTSFARYAVVSLLCFQQLLGMAGRQTSGHERDGIARADDPCNAVAWLRAQPVLGVQIVSI
jgi:putative flippase GtrA